VELHGDYSVWSAANEGTRDALKVFLDKLPDQQRAFKGINDWIFYRPSSEYICAGDLSVDRRSMGILPLLKEYKIYLARMDIDLLVLICPVKEEVHFDHLPSGIPKPKDDILNPFSRKLLRDIQAQGVEVVDLLPVFLSAKQDSNSNEVELFQKQSVHWTNAAFQIAAKEISERIREYGWYAELSAEGTTYSIVDTTFELQGDIVRFLPQEEQTDFSPTTLAAQQVRDSKGEPNPPCTKNAPILLIGDSSIDGGFEFGGVRSAGLGSHIASRAGLPVCMRTSWAGAQPLPQKTIDQYQTLLAGKRLVVYVMFGWAIRAQNPTWDRLTNTRETSNTEGARPAGKRNRLRKDAAARD
jgi:hypothetical protein